MPTIHINLGYFVELGNLPFSQIVVRLFLDGGWILFAVVLLKGFWMLWIDYRQAKFASRVVYTLLAIDIPRDNLQTPKAVEHIFAQLSGAHQRLDRYEKYWLGKFQLSISFEIVSVGGYVQFLVHTPRKYRDLIEASVYAQYPTAEIIEVLDYTERVPSNHPHPEWDVFGTEFVLKRPQHLPLRTWMQFEHTSAEDTFKDPLSGVLEVLSSLKQGEQMWIQFILTPTDDAWKKKAEKEVDKMLGKKPVSKKGLVSMALEIPGGMVNEAIGQLTGVTWESDEAEKKKKESPPAMLGMSPGERNVLEAVQMKLSKIGFYTKIRMVYSGRRDVFSKGRVLAIKGAFSQFGSLDMNQLKGYGPVIPKSDYFYQRWSVHTKKSNLVRAYKGRSRSSGATSYILNVEELATLYHFPMMDVKAPLVSKTDAKRSEPPARLPTKETVRDKPFKSVPPPEPAPDPGDGAPEGTPSNLPFA